MKKTTKDLSDTLERDDKYDNDDDIDSDFEVAEANVKSPEKLNETLTSMDCSLLKRVQKDREVGYGKRKFKEATDQLASSFSDVISGLDDLTIFNDCDVLMRQMKEKIDTCHKEELFTLIPEHWSREIAVSFFNVQKEKGILGISDSIHRHGLSDALLARAKS